MPAIILSQKMVDVSFPLMCELTVVEGWGVDQGEGGPMKQQCRGTRGEMEPTHWKETRAPRCTGNFFFPSHHTCLQEETVMSLTSHLGGQWWLEESNRSRGAAGGGGRREEEREGLLRGLKKLSVLFTMDTMFWPLRLEHNNTCGFKFLPSPCSVFPSILHQPLSHTSYDWGSKTWISHLLRLLCNYLEKRRRWGGRIKWGSEERGVHIKSAWKRNTLHSSITLHKCNKRMKRRENGGVVRGCRVWEYIKMGCVQGELVPGGNLNKLITAIGFFFLLLASFPLAGRCHLIGPCLRAGLWLVKRECENLKTPANEADRSSKGSFSPQLEWRGAGDVGGGGE